MGRRSRTGHHGRGGLSARTGRSSIPGSAAQRLWEAGESLGSQSAQVLTRGGAAKRPARESAGGQRRADEEERAAQGLRHSEDAVIAAAAVVTSDGVGLAAGQGGRRPRVVLWAGTAAHAETP